MGSITASRKPALHALMEKDTSTLLSIMLDRLYVLRNQLTHGGAMWNGSAQQGAGEGWSRHSGHTATNAHRVDDAR
jgi:hypothetical protein